MEQEKSLTQLKEGETARIVQISSQSELRRRLFDLGLIEGTQVECLFKSPSGDPAAYLIRGAAIALRQKDSNYILIDH